MSYPDFLNELRRLCGGFAKSHELTEERCKALYSLVEHRPIEVWKEAVTLGLCEPTFPGRRKIEYLVEDATEKVRARERFRHEREAREATAKLQDVPTDDRPGAFWVRTWMQVMALQQQFVSEDEILKFLAQRDAEYPGYGFVAARHKAEGRGAEQLAVW